jgi:hypothetical protein
VHEILEKILQKGFFEQQVKKHSLDHSNDAKVKTPCGFSEVILSILSIYRWDPTTVWRMLGRKVKPLEWKALFFCSSP